MPLLFWKRLLGIIFYIISWSDAFPLGTHLFYTFPFLYNLKIITIPIQFIEDIIPLGFSKILIFLIIFLGIVRNSKADYLLRFHALQAILINILIIISIYFYQVIIFPTCPPSISETFTSLIFIGTLFLMIFASIKCFQGQEGDIPWISEAVRMQL